MVGGTAFSDCEDRAHEVTQRADHAGIEDEPVADPGALASRQSDPSMPDNGAVRAHRIASDALAARDRAAFAATRAGDFVVTVHVPDGCGSFLPAGGDLGDDADTAIGLWSGRDDPSDEQVVAVDGDDRCLIRVVDDVASDVFEHLVVIRSCGGRVASEDWFSADQIDDAMALLRSRPSTGRTSGASGEWRRRPR